MAPLNVGVALLIPDVVAGMAPATSPPVTDRVVPNPFKVADHHGARFATWTATVLISNRQMGRVVATDKRDGGLYVLERGHSVFISVLKKFTSNCFKAHLRTSGNHHQLSCPYSPAQNGCAERKHRHVTETGLALLFHSHTSPRFWVDAFSTAAYIINRLLVPLL
uniref:Integrase catalytic domain-containing protein n=1 Tax=Vitis vinifera TaxID=29760 RepID=A5APW8_VITVI|nr:hypothetical protein VITISV_023277 [Vitis vinifera]